MASRGLPLAGACHADGVLRVRIEGGEPVKAARDTIGGERMDDRDDAFWAGYATWRCRSSTTRARCGGVGLRTARRLARCAARRLGRRTALAESDAAPTDVQRFAAQWAATRPASRRRRASRSSRCRRAAARTGSSRRSSTRMRSSIPAACAPTLTRTRSRPADANQSQRSKQGPRPGRRSGSDPARVRALRLCNATCPTWVLGNEPTAARAHLPDQAAARRRACGEHAQHLDRCLTCRNCETTCRPACAITRCSTSAARKPRARARDERAPAARGLRHVVPRPATFARC